MILLFARLFSYNYVSVYNFIYLLYLIYALFNHVSNIYAFIFLSVTAINATIESSKRKVDVCKNNIQSLLRKPGQIANGIK